MIKVIKTEVDYKAALARIEQLMEIDPDLETPEADELEVLSLLVEQYETERFPVRLPDPIEAIKFRMEQQNLQPRDLIQYIGSRSKVSEVLARKRPLSISMMRALNKGLGIPAEVLLQQTDKDIEDEEDIDWKAFPLRKMVERGWIEGGNTPILDNAEALVKAFFAPLGSPASVVALYRRTDHIRSDRPMDREALLAWSAWILRRAQATPPITTYQPGVVTPTFMREVAMLSWSDQGPLLAKEFLEKHGIALIIEPHLPETYVDGAALLMNDGRPVVGLSIRHDRIDNFWFCLMHELAHIALHLKDTNMGFIDNLDSKSQGDQREIEADDLAGEVLIPSSLWETEPVRITKTPQGVERAAKRLKVHPAIIAGRIRHESASYHLLKQMVGHGAVRPLFPGHVWK